MSTLKLSTLSNVAGTQSTAIENAINGSAKAWVNFNGTGTVAIRRAFNVSSITDNGTGDYTVNFTNAMPDADYSSTSYTGQDANNGGLIIPSAYNTSSHRISVYSVGAGPVRTDYLYVNLTIFR